MSRPLADLVALLDLEPTGPDSFRGRSPDVDLQRVFGGQVAGQALVAVGRTVGADRPVHSLHGYFLRPGDPRVPIDYRVERLHDGRTFSARRVVAVQHDAAIFVMSASFQRAEDGLDHQAAMPSVPAPEELPTFDERVAPYRSRMAPQFLLPKPVDIRYVGDPPWAAGERTTTSAAWVRADGDLPDDPLVHVCVLAFTSDFTLLDSVLLAHGVSWAPGGVVGASLDHAMWFHRPFRADQWMLYVTESPTASGGRGLAHGSLYSRDGRLCATVMQEGLLRRTG